MNSLRPKRGEIWLINFDPTVGSEIMKMRPGVILSADALGILPLRIVAPVTNWRPEFKNNVWHVHFIPNKENGLKKESAADLLQIRSLDIRRFVKRIGVSDQNHLEEMICALLNVVQFEGVN